MAKGEVSVTVHTDICNNPSKSIGAMKSPAVIPLVYHRLGDCAPLKYLLGSAYQWSHSATGLKELETHIFI